MSEVSAEVNSEKSPHRAFSLLLMAPGLVLFALMALKQGQMPLGLAGPSIHHELRLLAGAFSSELLLGPQGWRYLGAFFVYSSLIHLVLCTVALHGVCSRLPRHWSSAWLLTIFVTTGVAGWLCCRAWYGPLGPALGGASGGIFGLIGAQVAVSLRERSVRLLDLLSQDGLFALVLIFTVGAANPAHLGALTVGTLIGGALHMYNPAQSKSALWFGTALGLLCLAASLWGASRLLL